MFKITQGKGFQITFANGYTVSVQFGAGNYCDNRDYSFYTPERDPALGAKGSETAEVAVFHSTGGQWYRPACFGEMNDDVKGWVTPDELPQLFVEVANLPTPGFLQITAKVTEGEE